MGYSKYGTVDYFFNLLFFIIDTKIAPSPSGSSAWSYVINQERKKPLALSRRPGQRSLVDYL